MHFAPFSIAMLKIIVLFFSHCLFSDGRYKILLSLHNITILLILINVGVMCTTISRIITESWLPPAALSGRGGRDSDLWEHPRTARSIDTCHPHTIEAQHYEVPGWIIYLHTKTKQVPVVRPPDTHKHRKCDQCVMHAGAHIPPTFTPGQNNKNGYWK